ncbi:hypothetical protein ABZ791_08090 [Streptomyces huasconensis]|uniref:Uncharacterized protein n=1 Tax=Streptomyces huasconensis TaxID=1854574 RepID=A0ABV3M3Y8_9ACTN
MQKAAQRALDGGPEAIDRFLAVDLAIARARDAETVTNPQLAVVAEEAGRRANSGTNTAKEASERAQRPAALAKTAAQKAAAETAAAKGGRC